MESRAEASVAALACAAAALPSMVRRMLPQISSSQLSTPPSENSPVEFWLVLMLLLNVLLLVRPRTLRDRAGIADRRIERRLALTDQRHGLAIGRLVLLQRLVRDVDIGHQPVERGVAVHGPPWAAIHRVARQGGAEHDAVHLAGDFLVVNRRIAGRQRPLVVRPDHAARHRQESEKGNCPFHMSGSHACAPPAWGSRPPIARASRLCESRSRRRKRSR